MMTEKLKHYLQAWQLTNEQLIAQTATSHVYTVDADDARVVLKLLTPIGIEDEHSGAVALHCFNGHGAVRLLRHDEGAHLLEYVAGTDLVPMVQRGQDEQAAEIIADVLNQLHHAYTGTPPNGLRPLKRWFRALFIKAEQDKQAGMHSIYRRAAPLAEKLLAEPQHETVLHGDIHHENIRYHAERGWLAYDPKGLYGERTYDAANTLCNPDMPELIETEARILNITGILARRMNLEQSRMLAFVFVYACLSASWSLEDGDDPQGALTIAALAEPLVEISV